MRIDRKHALKLWDDNYGNVLYADDFHGSLMCREAYGDPDFYIVHYGEKIYCGWNIHHVLPKAKGGSNEKCNLCCTNIKTNELAGDKNTFRIDDCLYQVKKIPHSHEYGIFEIK